MDNIKRVIAGCRIHRHSNKVEAHGIVEILLIGGVAAVICGVIAFLFSQKTLPFISLGLIVIGLKFVLSAAIDKHRINHVIFTTVYACVFSFLTIGVWHYCNYRYYTAYLQPKPALGEPSQTMSFLSFMNSRDKESLAGDNLPRYYWDTRGMYNINNCMGDCLAVLLVTILVRRVAGKPSCFSCNSWYREFEIGGMQNHSSQVVAAIQVGRQVPVEIAKKMSDFGLVDHRPGSEINRLVKCKLSLLLCPSCELDTCLIRVYKIRNIANQHKLQHGENLAAKDQQVESVVYDMMVTPEEAKGWLLAMNRHEMADLLFENETVGAMA